MPLLEATYNEDDVTHFFRHWIASNLVNGMDAWYFCKRKRKKRRHCTRFNTDLMVKKDTMTGSLQGAACPDTIDPLIPIHCQHRKSLLVQDENCISEISLMAATVDGPVESVKEDDYAWLEAIESPDDLYMRSGIYTGPAVQDLAL